MGKQQRSALIGTNLIHIPGIDDDPLNALIESTADLGVRKLVDRNEMAVDASFTPHRIEREGRLRPTTALAAAERVSERSMTQVRCLERQGLAQRLGDRDDDRVALLSLTDSIVQSRFANERVAMIP